MDDRSEPENIPSRPTESIDPAELPRRTFRLFFFRGLGVLLPTVLTIWLLVLAFDFVSEKIADPINRGVRHLVVYTLPWPKATDRHYEQAIEVFQISEKYASNRAEWKAYAGPQIDMMGKARWEQVKDEQMRHWLSQQSWYPRLARRLALEQRWDNIQIFGYPVMNLVGLVIAVFAIYFAGLFLGSYLGRRLYRRGEDVFKRTPVFKQVYPHVKQVTDFFVGDDDKKKLKFDTVVAVEYPRKGMWSLGLVTGDTLQTIQNAAGEECMTVFIPSSPTPFTGYVVTVPKRETIQLNITIDDALRFSVSGGVIVPESQLIKHAEKPADRDPKAPASSADTRSNGQNG